MMQYPADYHNQIILGDALEIMQGIPDASIPLILTSPPYNLKNSTGNGMKGIGNPLWNGALRYGYDNHDDNLPHDVYVQWQRDCLTQMLRIIPENGAIYYIHKWRVQDRLLQDRQDIVDGFPVRQIIIWDRGSGMNFNPHFYLPTYEVIYLIAKPKFILIPGMAVYGDIWRFKPENGRKNKHPAPFPLALATRVMETAPADIVLDPFVGSGTTAVAAKIAGRKYIGIDNSPKYCQMAEKRLRNPTHTPAAALIAETQKPLWEE